MIIYSWFTYYKWCRPLLVGGIPTPLKNHGVKVSWYDDIPNMMGKIKAMFQTTNQTINGIISWEYSLDLMGISMGFDGYNIYIYIYIRVQIRGRSCADGFGRYKAECIGCTTTKCSACYFFLRLQNEEHNSFWARKIIQNQYYKIQCIWS